MASALSVTGKQRPGSAHLKLYSVLLLKLLHFLAVLLPTADWGPHLE